MEKKISIFCYGNECPVRNTCLRYTEIEKRLSCDGEYRLILKCRNQVHYLQDERNVNKDGNEHRK